MRLFLFFFLLCKALVTTHEVYEEELDQWIYYAVEAFDDVIDKCNLIIKQNSAVPERIELENRLPEAFWWTDDNNEIHEVGYRFHNTIQKFLVLWIKSSATNNLAMADFTLSLIDLFVDALKNTTLSEEPLFTYFKLIKHLGKDEMTVATVNQWKNLGLRDILKEASPYVLNSPWEAIATLDKYRYYLNKISHPLNELQVYNLGSIIKKERDRIVYIYIFKYIY
eukprot:GHVL01012845.1.p1 GENE.GHVL01012845.1~~GHVL01012845.1.p1  ORF type:complete len:224 (-),score=28.31 GHVL01012845.1:40-711(-)